MGSGGEVGTVVDQGSCERRRGFEGAGAAEGGGGLTARVEGGKVGGM